MKHFYTLIIVLIVGSFSHNVKAQENLFIKDYLERLENSRKYLIKVAEIMPIKKYNFKATPESLTFGENLMHIGFAIDWHSQSLLGGRKAKVWKTDTIYKVKNKSQKEMILIINKTFDEAIDLIKKLNTNQLNEALDYFGLKRSKRQILLLLADHITHHRGQMLVYLRLNGIVPPRYVLFQ